MKTKLFPITTAIAIAAFLLIVIVTPAPAQQSWQTSPITPHLIVAVTSGSTPIDARSIQITVSSDFAGTIDGQIVTGAAVTQPLCWYASGDHLLAAMPYTRSAGTIYIAYSK